MSKLKANRPFFRARGKTRALRIRTVIVRPVIDIMSVWDRPSQADHGRVSNRVGGPLVGGEDGARCAQRAFAAHPHPELERASIGTSDYEAGSGRACQTAFIALWQNREMRPTTGPVPQLAPNRFRLRAPRPKRRLRKTRPNQTRVEGLWPS